MVLAPIFLDLASFVESCNSRCKQAGDDSRNQEIDNCMGALLNTLLISFGLPMNRAASTPYERVKIKKALEMVIGRIRPLQIDKENSPLAVMVVPSVQCSYDM